MAKKLFYIFVSFFIINFQIQIITSIDTCSPANFCDECQFCGEETKTYDSCSYYHMFCRETKNTLKYSPYFKNEYINFFNLDTDTTSFCGSSIYYLKYYGNSEKKEILIFNSENKNLINIHCHFYIDLENSYLLNPRIKFEMIRYGNSNDDNHLKYQISSILTYNDQVRSQSTETLASGDIRYGEYFSREIVLNTALTYEFFVDFLENNYITSEEILRIKITYGQKYEEEEVKGNEEEESSSSTGITMGIGIGSAIFFLLIICCCCRK